MAKSKKTLFECQSCGHQSIKWLGKCSSCGQWDSYVELSEKQIEVLKETDAITTSSKNRPTPITQIQNETATRFSSGDSELDLVLGGGIVDGSLVLIGGSPGVGKSTLLLKIAGNIASKKQDVLYVSGEESLAQIKLRGDRLKSNYDNLYLLGEIRLEEIVANIYANDYKAIIIDSIQTIYSEKITSSPGSVTQVREITFEFMRIAKEKNIAIFIIGHITKEGSIAGPRILEHMVDVVLYFEGDSSKELRMLRGFKNRFGTTSEVGIFEMSASGLISAKNISKKFFTRGEAQSGSAITVVMEGSRPIVLEVQALVSPSGYSNPKRSATGFDTARLTMLLALLEKKLEIALNDYDVFINIAGGIKINETSADLAIIAAIISSFKDRPISKDTVFLGEVSLTGDVRETHSYTNRIKEAKTQEFKKVVLPASVNEKIKGIKYYNVDVVLKMLEWM